MKQIIIALFACFTVFISSSAMADSHTASFTGMFNGANCMFFSGTCPKNMPDAHVATEPDFVLTQPGGKYYFVINIDRAIKVKYLHKDVKVTGKLKDSSTIIAKTLEEKKDGKYIMVWSLEDEIKERALMNQR